MKEMEVDNTKRNYGRIIEILSRKDSPVRSITIEGETIEFIPLLATDSPHSWAVQVDFGKDKESGYMKREIRKKSALIKNL